VGRTATRCSQRGGYCDPYELIRIKFKSLAMRLGDLRTFTMASCAIRSGSLRHLTLRDTPSQEMKHLLWRVAFEFSLFTFSSVDRTMQLPEHKSFDLVIPKLAMQNPIRKYILLGKTYNEYLTYYKLKKRSEALYKFSAFNSNVSTLRCACKKKTV